MFSPAEGADPHSYGIFSGLNALGQPVGTTVASRMKAGDIVLKPITAVTQLFQSSAPASVPSGGGMSLLPDGSAPSPGVVSSDNTALFLGIGVALLAIGGAVYMKKRKAA